MQCIETAALELSYPARMDLVQGHRVQIMELLTALPYHSDEIRGFELLQMLCHGLACHFHLRTEFRQGLTVPVMEPVICGSSGTEDEMRGSFDSVQDDGTKKEFDG